MNTPHPEAKVSVVRTQPRTIRNDLERLLELVAIQGLDPLRPTRIKFNGNVRRYYPGSNTSRWFIDALLASLKDRGFRDLGLIEGNLPQFAVETMLRETALDRVLERHGVPCINYEQLERHGELPALLDGVQLINTPTPHTHGFAVISCATKNLWGLLPVDRYKHHPILSEKLLEMNSRLTMLTLVDGTVSMFGDSTRTGTPVRTDLLFGGRDNLSVDVVAARIMGFTIAEVPLLTLAAERGVLAGVPPVDGDLSWEQLPNFHFPYKRGAARRITMWLEGLSGETAITRTTRNLLYSERGMRYYSTLVGWYVEARYAAKRRELLGGPWMEYELRDGAIPIPPGT